MKTTFKSITPAVMIAAGFAWSSLAEQMPEAPKPGFAVSDRNFPDGYLTAPRRNYYQPERHKYAENRRYSDKQATDSQYSQTSPSTSGPTTPGQQTYSQPATSSQSYASSTSEPFGTVSQAKGVIGMEVQNGQNEKLGKVEDVAMSFSSGRVVALVVSVGGVLGVGDTLIAVPPSEFSQDAQNKVLHLNRTKDELKNAPKLDVAKWDEFQQPSNIAEVYRYYGVRPYATDTADTTIRYRTDNGPSAFQQGNNDSDLNTTARIRKDLLKRDDLSISAHNVTIVTSNGRVTLRGTVQSEDEKRIVAEVAQSTASPGNIDNQLEVTAATNK